VTLVPDERVEKVISFCFTCGVLGLVTLQESEVVQVLLPLAIVQRDVSPVIEPDGVVVGGVHLPAFQVEGDVQDALVVLVVVVVPP
jgi:hypothetical protein